MFQAKGENVLLELLKEEGFSTIGSIIVSKENQWKQRNARILSVDDSDPIVQQYKLKSGMIVRLPKNSILVDNFMAKDVYFTKARAILFIVDENKIPEELRKAEEAEV